MRRKSISFFISLTVLSFLFLKPQTVSAQSCTDTSPCAKCCETGPTCSFTACPGGYQLSDPAAATCISECKGGTTIDTGMCASGYGVVFTCEPVPPITGTTPCPTDRPYCSIEAAMICAGLGGSAQSCTYDATTTGNCCVWVDPNINCGGHLQRCCGGALGVGGNSCDPDVNPLTCTTMPSPGLPTCCYAGDTDPNCGGGVTLPMCPGSCSDVDCSSRLGEWALAPLSYQCPTTHPFCCVPVGDGVNLFCDPGTGDLGIRTAIGCINASNPRAFIIQLIGYAIKIGGGISLLTLVYAGFVFVTSFGNAERIAYSRELFFNSAAFLLIISSTVVIINFIGIRVLALTLFGFHV